MNNQKLIISPSRTGGLCNRMFQIACGYGIAKEQNKDLVITTINENKHSNIDYFDNIFKNITVDKQLIIQHKFREPNHMPLSWVDIPNINENMLLIGYFQNEKYFIDYRNEIFELFKIDNETEMKLKTKYIDIDDCYFIHIRRGDYVKKIS